MERAFDRVVLGKLAAASILSGLYYVANGPLVWFDKRMYGVRGMFSWWPGNSIPAGINGGFPVITDPLQKLIDETKKDLKLTEPAAKNIQFRCATIVSPQYAGSGRLHTAYAALPDYVNIASISGLRANSLNAYLETLYKWKVPDPDMWLTGLGKLLVDSFVLSEKGKKFVVARQAYMADNNEALVFSAIFFLLTYIFYFSTDIVRKKTRGSGNPLVRPFGIVTSAYVSFGAYFMLRFLHVKQLTRDADAKAVSKGEYNSQQYENAKDKGQPLPVDPDYYEGAIEFYSKEIQRNQALRLLIKQTTPWYKSLAGRFSEDGDFKPHVFSKQTPPKECLKNIVSWKLGSRPIASDN